MSSVKLFRRTIKIFAWSLVAFAVAIAGLILIGRATDDEPTDNSLLEPMMAVSDVDNAYLLVSYTQAADFSFGADSELIAELLERRWNLPTAEGLLARHQHDIAMVVAAAKREKYQSEGDYYLDSRDYSSLGFLVRLMILQSRVNAETGKLIEATDSLLSGLKFSDLLKRDTNASLISFSIGAAYQDKLLTWLHQMVDQYPLQETSLIRLSAGLESLASIEQDGFGAAFTGEYEFTKLVLSDFVDVSVLERMKRQSDYGMGYMGNPEASVLVRMLEMAGTVLAPEYFYQKNKLLSQFEQRYAHFQELALQGCDKSVDFSLPWAKTGKDITMFSLLSPNGLGERDYLVAEPEFKRFFDRRCLIAFHIEALKTVIAIKHFSLNSSAPLVDLGQLVNAPMSSISVDPFSDEPLKFDSKNSQLYSLGTDFRADADRVIYHANCYKDLSCSASPMVPVKFIAALSE